MSQMIGAKRERVRSFQSMIRLFQNQDYERGWLQEQEPDGMVQKWNRGVVPAKAEVWPESYPEHPEGMYMNEIGLKGLRMK
jgi:hypothetical protein